MLEGLVSHDNGKTLQTMIDVFTEIGYNVTYKVLKAINYDVAQKRERIIIIGTRKDLNDIEFKFPKPFDHIPTLREALKMYLSQKVLNIQKRKKCSRFSTSRWVLDRLT